MTIVAIDRIESANGQRIDLELSTDLPCKILGYYDRRADGVWTIHLEWHASGNSIQIVQLAPDASVDSYGELALGRLNDAVDAVIGSRSKP